MKSNNAILQTKKENIIVDLIFSHKGADNCISAEEIVKELHDNGFSIKTRSINTLITKIKMSRKLPVCYKRHCGYFWATKKSEIVATIGDLQSMVNSLTHRNATKFYN